VQLSAKLSDMSSTASSTPYITASPLYICGEVSSTGSRPLDGHLYLFGQHHVYQVRGLVVHPPARA
jgi:hypothetical protein